MATLPHATASARRPSVTFFAEPPEFSLRARKNRLQARFPSVRSSHMSEAIAAGLGFGSHAALLAAPQDQLMFLGLHRFETSRFKERLLQLQYPIQPDFGFGPAVASVSPPGHYLERLEEIRRLEAATSRHSERAAQLRQQCIEEFAEAFGLGHRPNMGDKSVIKRWDIGVDHAFCLPGWGRHFNANRSYVDFPGSDHRRMFYDTLPLDGFAKPRTAEVCSAMVSMPYADLRELPDRYDEGAHIAGVIGWTCEHLPQWSWHLPGQTTLVLFRRSTPADQVRAAWSRSFKRWLMENRTTLSKSSRQLKRYAIEDTIKTEHLPFDLTDFEDCRERYLKEFAPRLYSDRDEVMGRYVADLMEKWLLERGGTV